MGSEVGETLLSFNGIPHGFPKPSARAKTDRSQKGCADLHSLLIFPKPSVRAKPTVVRKVQTLTLLIHDHAEKNITKWEASRY